MPERMCPPHQGLDDECHNHESELQTLCHNGHCNLLGCEYALKGFERHDNVPTHKPRTRLEELLKLGDKLIRPKKQK